jgi:hypothetical protein
MPEYPPLHPATRDEIVDALSFALRFEGRKSFRAGGGAIAEIRPSTG